MLWGLHVPSGISGATRGCATGDETEKAGGRTVPAGDGGALLGGEGGRGPQPAIQGSTPHRKSREIRGLECRQTLISSHSQFTFSLCSARCSRLQPSAAGCHASPVPVAGASIIALQAFCSTSHPPPPEFLVLASLRKLTAGREPSALSMSRPQPLPACHFARAQRTWCRR